MGREFNIAISISCNDRPEQEFEEVAMAKASGYMKAKVVSMLSVFGGCDSEIIIARIVRHRIIRAYGVKSGWSGYTP